MRSKGYYRLLLSYIPVFFLVVLILVATFFLAISELTRKQTEEANRMVTRQAVQTLDQSLSSIALSLKKEGESNTELADFFQASHLPGTFEKYGLWKQVEALKTSMPLLDTVYLVRFKDGVVLNDDQVLNLTQFGDQEFVRNIMGLPTTLSWSDPRLLPDLRKPDGGGRVISLVTPYPFFNGAEGMIVSNIRVDALQSVILPFTSDRLSYIDVYDRYNRPLFDGVSSGTGGKPVVELASSYTGWKFAGGIRSDSLFGVISTMSRIYYVLGFLAVVLGMVMLTYTSRRNYKPIELILNRVQSYTDKKKGELLTGSRVSDYQFIDSAFENLVELAHSYEKQHGENLVYRKKVLLLKLMDGEGTLTREEWEEEMEKLELPGEYREVALGMVEIDQYTAFVQRYSSRDQYLLKYVISSVVQELAQEAGVRVMTEWLAPERLGILYLSAPAALEAEGAYAAVARKAVDWVRINLSHTITVGLSGVSCFIEDVARLRGDAEKALNHKITYGGNRLIRWRDIPAEKGGDLSRPLQCLKPLVQALRKDEEWTQPLDTLFVAVRESLLAKDDLHGFFRFLLFTLNQEMSQLSQEMKQYWQTDASPRLEQALDGSESLEELRQALSRSLSGIMEEAAALRKRRVNSLLLHKVKQYLQTHYANPDLSLNHLSDEFQYSTTYLSSMFKEEFGEKFVDYLVRIRMEQAMKLLAETDHPIQDVAVQVGYTHSISFIRMFKKLTGKTPGDYRKQMVLDRRYDG